MNEKIILEVVTQALKQGANIEINFHNVPAENAENLIDYYAKKLHRDYQHDTNQDGEFKAKWFEVTSHDDDQLRVTAFYDGEVES
ncbi:hypothetical protein K7T73_12650 [Bacillus badius]|uniref:hypothetical protein n=1 Tax=Bacillus badius TaxID=1455 RepID=UPI001CC03FEE|nr:hypothetical protein [Bacillus badius]UAT29449.1 hypothetical protein K7T73_12650 [Bacillus badius]